MSIDSNQTMDDDFDRDEFAVSRENDLGLRRKPTKKRPSFVDVPGFHFDYKNAQQLKLFLSDRGKILPRRMTGLNAKQQREVTKAIRRARQLAMLPYTSVD
jgi:small subunit ribosomal protein S18